MSNKIGI